MERYKTFFALSLAALVLAGCVYVPPPDYYGGPPPPPDIPPPFHVEEPLPPDYYYFGRGKSRRDYEMDIPRRRRGRTDYLREADPDYAMEEPIEGPDGVPPDGYAPDTAPSTSPTERSQSTSPPPTPEKKIDPNSVPYATRTNTPGRAKSPYPPYRELDVSGMKSGSMAKDPTTGKVFRVP